MRFSTARNDSAEVDLATKRNRAMTSELWALRNPGYTAWGSDGYVDFLSDVASSGAVEPQA